MVTLTIPSAATASFGSKTRKRIVQYSLTGHYLATFDSIKMASIETGLSRDAIFGVLKGARTIAREFLWKYADSFDTIPLVIEVPEKLPPPACPIKCRRKINLPVYDYPYQDQYLADLEGEIWKDLPGMETYCMVSNLGRVKSLSRFVDKPGHGRHFLKERILLQNVRRFKTNKYTGEWSQCLYFALHIEKRTTQMAVARAVYSTFVQRLKDFSEDNIFILHHDLDPFNNRVENLYAATRSETGRRNVEKGILVPFDIASFVRKRKESNINSQSDITIQSGKNVNIAK